MTSDAVRTALPELQQSLSEFKLPAARVAASAFPRAFELSELLTRGFCSAVCAPWGPAVVEACARAEELGPPVSIPSSIRLRRMTFCFSPILHAEQILIETDQNLFERLCTKGRNSLGCVFCFFSRYSRVSLSEIAVRWLMPLPAWCTGARCSLALETDLQLLLPYRKSLTVLPLVNSPTRP
jgi:hypothetical protein